MSTKPRARRRPALGGGALPPPDGPLQGADVTRERLLQAAHELLYERMGASATVSEICTRAGVNVAMVKYCFGGKDGLLDTLLERVMANLAGEIRLLAGQDLTATDKLRRHVAEIVRNYVRYPYVNRLINERLLSESPDAAARMSRAFAIPARAWYAELIADGQAHDGWRELDPTLFFFSIVGICEFLFSARAWLEHGFGETADAALVERYIEHATALVVDGLLVRPPA